MLIKENEKERDIRSRRRDCNLSKILEVRVNCADIWSYPDIWRESTSRGRNSNCRDPEMEKVLGVERVGLKEQLVTSMPEAGDESERAGGESRMKENLPVVEPITEPV